MSNKTHPKPIVISDAMLEAGTWAISPFIAHEMTEADKAEMLRQAYLGMRSVEACEESGLTDDEMWEAV